MALHAHWDALRNGRPAPHSREIRPEELGRSLARTFLIEGDSAANAVYRLAGSAIFDLFQRELRGRSWREMFDEPSRAQAEMAMADVLEHGHAVMIEAEGRTAGHRLVPVEIFLLPLSGEPGAARRTIGALSPCDEPYWLGAHPIVELSLLRVERVASRLRLDGRERAGSGRRGPIRRLKHLALYIGGRAR